jgi:hypothetical protein
VEVILIALVLLVSWFVAWALDLKPIQLAPSSINDTARRMMVARKPRVRVKMGRAIT